jgi:hypothetical protein
MKKQNVARMGETEEHINFWWGNLKEKARLEDLGVDEMETLKRIQDRIRNLGVDSSGAGYGSVKECFYFSKKGNEHSVCIKCWWEFLD